MSAAKMKVQDNESVLGNIGFSCGRHYWEITVFWQTTQIDEFSESEDITIGIALRNTDLLLHPSEIALYYGYICCAGKKISNSGETASYGEVCALHDNIGILLEFSEKDAKLTFYRNKVNKE